MPDKFSDQLEKRVSGPWLLFHYLPTTLFSLRMTYATSKGGKTLLLPTPYAVKLAFVDACFRMQGRELAENVLDWIKARDIRLSPPEHCLVQNTFLKVLQEDRNAPKGHFTSTIAYREFCFYQGELIVGLNSHGLSDKQTETLKRISVHINYFGKRGSFFQFLGSEASEDLPPGFTHPGKDQNMRTNTYGVSNFLDDFGEAAIKEKNLFEKISTYSQAGMPILGKHRILTPTLLPYRLERSSKAFSHYKRIGGNE